MNYDLWVMNFLNVFIREKSGKGFLNPDCVLENLLQFQTASK